MTRGPAKTPPAEPPKPVLRGRAREVFREVINEEVTQEAIRHLLSQALSMGSFVYGHCVNCRRRVQCEVPDVKKRIDALISLLEQAEGKPDQVDQSVSIVVERPALPV